MLSPRQLRRWTALCALACTYGAAWGRPARPSAWEQALAKRAAFEAASSHTRADYTRVEQAFRAVYYADPADPHAADAVIAQAALEADEARAFHDETSARMALKHYEFLRTQYPGSPLRDAALLAEARLEAEQLHDPAAAREQYKLLVRMAPASVAARTARAELAALESRKTGARREEQARNSELSGRARSRGEGLEMAGPEAIAPDRAAEQKSSVERPATAPTATTGRVGEERTPVAQPAASEADESYKLDPPGKALVSGIRHWSTSTYTRVAIDLGGEVTFEAARVANPDRLYFDLHGARLAPELVGKSFDVTDNGFLKRIRAAQEPGGVTRVVLDVSDVSQYSAFLLPNPERLIIDIHGGVSPAKRVSQPAPAEVAADEPAEVPVAPSASRRATVAANRSGLPPMAPTDGGEAVRPVTPMPETSTALARTTPAPRTAVPAHSTAARPVPNAVAVRSPETASEVAAVSAQPGRVEATRMPTRRPVAAVIQPARPTPDADDVPTPVPVTLGRGTGRVFAATPAKAADRTADGETSLVRALGLRVGRIVIDAGHGGHDSGTLGVDGIQEKDVVLDVALRLGRLLHERLGAEIIYTRSDDTFIPLETRTAIANKAQADLFLSIHANSSQDPTARGVETYYLNFTSDPTALDVAARENAAGGQTVHQLSDLVKKIALKDKIAESREFAADVNSSLYAGLQKGNDGLKNRGVKKAPFVVLIGANMPSILAEISFVTNARDADELRDPAYRERVAESLYNGVAKYENGLAGGKAAAGLRASARQ